MTNYELLQKLDGLLNDVDATLLSMEITKEQKSTLTEMSYKLYSLAEVAAVQQIRKHKDIQ